MNEIPGHPNITTRVALEPFDAEAIRQDLESETLASSTACRILQGETPSMDDLCTLALQYIATASWSKTAQVRVDAGLYFEHTEALDPAPSDDEQFLIVWTNPKGLTEILPALWNSFDECWSTAKGTIVDRVYAALRIPDELSEMQRMYVDDEKDAESEGGG